jgi:hypothetical protein
MTRSPRSIAGRLLAGAVLAVAWIAILPAAVSGAADDAGTLERRVKAAFLYQFVAYVEWPPDAFTKSGTPITIAVTGAESLAEELRQVVSGRTVGGRQVTVRRVGPGELLEGVHILFIGMAENARLGELTRSTQSLPILTVTESTGALERGSMINFVLDQRRVRFEVALDTAEKRGLRLSSRLLAVARDVRVGGR